MPSTSAKLPLRPRLIVPLCTIAKKPASTSGILSLLLLTLSISGEAVWHANTGDMEENETQSIVNPTAPLGHGPDDPGGDGRPDRQLPGLSGASGLRCANRGGHGGHQRHRGS